MMTWTWIIHPIEMEHTHTQKQQSLCGNAANVKGSEKKTKKISAKNGKNFLINKKSRCERQCDNLKSKYGSLIHRSHKNGSIDQMGMGPVSVRSVLTRTDSLTINAALLFLLSVIVCAVFFLSLASLSGLLLYVKERSQNPQTTVIGLCLIFFFFSRCRRLYCCDSFRSLLVALVVIGLPVFRLFGCCCFSFYRNIHRLLPETGIH